MRKQFALWVAVALSCVLAGCGGGGGGSDGGISGPSEPPPSKDTTPDGLQFAPVANATRDGWIVSERITISGINTQVPISIENGEYAIDSGAFTAAAGTVSAGQSVTVRVRASATYSKVTIARLTVGSESTVFEVTAELPDYSPDNVSYDGQDVLYLLSNTHSLVFRWSVAQQRYLDALPFTPTGNTAPKIAVSLAQHRLYLGYTTGAIRYIDTNATDQSEVAFATTAMGVGGLASVGNYLLAQDGSGAWATHYVFDSTGRVTDQEEWNRYSREYAWDSVTSRVYFFRDDTSPNDLHYEVIDQTTGQITAQGETPYHGAYSIQPPIRVSVSGQYVLLGSGDLYRQSDLQWSGSVGTQIVDARWFADGSLVTLSTQGNQTTLRRLNATSLKTVEQVTYTGQALRVVGTDARMTVAVTDNGTVHLHDYVPNNDSDGDGVSNTEDAFPLDPAASIDSDRDGYPDSWNTGRGPGDSTTGLTLDAFPQDAACYLASHGTGGICNYDVTVPNYVPDQVIQDGDTVYLLSSVNRRVYRWSISLGAYRNPYVVGLSQGFTTLAPTKMTHSSAHHRLYLGYSNGAIQYIDTSSGNAAEVQFANTAMGVGGLAAVGNYVLAQDGSGAWATHYVFNASGAVTAKADWNRYSREYAWDPTTSRVYFFRDDTSPNDLHFEVIDQTNGTISASGETPYHGDYSIQPPIRVSVGGQYVLLGSGDIYNRNGLTWSGSLGTQIADGRWFADGSLVALSTANNQTTLRRRAGNNLTNVEQLTYSGQGLRVVGSDARMAVLVIDNGTVQFHIYVPNDDSDNDGVANTLDAFPLDPAASVDSDRDGYPDAWNAGRSQSDSTTGLSLDAFPQDSACYLVSHGSGGVCNYAATVPNYVPDQVVQQGDTVYLLSSANRRVYRWSITSGTYLNPYIVGINQGFSTIAPGKIAYSSAHQRLYLGYSTGAIQYIDVTSPGGAEVPFANTAMSVGGLAAAGNFVLAQDGSGAWARHYVIDSSGVIRDQPDWNYYSREYAWDPVTSRAYFFRDNMSPNDLHYEVIDQNTGLVTAEGETPYHGSYNIQPPIRVSVSGQYVLLGSGDIYRQNDLTWNGSLGTQIADARWFADGSLVTLVTASNQTRLRRLGNTLVTQEQLNYTGQALRIVGSDTRMAVLVIDNGTVQFHIYVPNDDSDNDGVLNSADAFPLDPAASVDTDHDGYPDAWNPGRGQSDSTTGLSLDAFPQDAACYLASHGSGGVCDYGATIPNYVPDQVLSEGDTIYLLSSAHRRVYRWSMATGAYMNPYVVGIDQGFSVLPPTRMAYSSAHQRLYLGYSTGAIQYIDVTANNGLEAPFANVAMGVDGLASVGNYVMAQDASGAWETHYVIASNGVITDQAEWNHYSREYAWDPVTSRVYFFRDGTSPNDLHYEVINQSTGEIASAGETPYHGDYGVGPPIRVSPDGQTILLGTGNLFDATGLTSAGTLGKSITDARWHDGVLIDLDTTDRVEIRNADTLAVLANYQYLGTPLRLAFGQTEVYLVHVMNGTTAFLRLPFYDQDLDSLPRWWEQLYGLSDANAADALGDLDGDGVSNADEYSHHSNPTVIDTDGDGLTDQQETVTYATDPARADSDGDGLSDYDEVVTYLSDPWDVDSDDDGYRDLDEVLYGGAPNDPSGLPQPLTTYSQSFENNPTLTAWTSAPQSAANWTITTATARTGTASLRSGTIGDSQRSSIRFRALTMAGTLRFQARVDAESCCDQLQVYVDGVQMLSIYANGQWYEYSVPLTLGGHDIEWRYQKNSYGAGGADAAFIDDVTFTH